MDYEEDVMEQRGIIGSRDLAQREVDLVNIITAKGAELGNLIDVMRMTPHLDTRWVSIGATHLQEGMAALRRAVEQPTFF